MAGLSAVAGNSSSDVDLQRRLFGGMSKDNPLRKNNNNFQDFYQSIGSEYKFRGNQKLSPDDQRTLLSNLAAAGTATTAVNRGVLNTAIDMKLAGISPQAAATLLGTYANGSIVGAKAMGAQLAHMLGDNRVKDQAAAFVGNQAYSLNYGATDGSGLLSTLAVRRGMSDPNKMLANTAAVASFPQWQTKDQYQMAYGQVQDLKFAKANGGNVNLAYALDRFRQNPQFMKIMQNGSLPQELIDEGMTPKGWEDFKQHYDVYGTKTIMARRIPSGIPGNKGDKIAKLLMEHNGDLRDPSITDDLRDAYASDMAGLGVDRETALSQWDERRRGLGVKHKKRKGNGSSSAGEDVAEQGTGAALGVNSGAADEASRAYNQGVGAVLNAQLSEQQKTNVFLERLLGKPGAFSVDYSHKPKKTGGK